MLSIPMNKKAMSASAMGDSHPVTSHSVKGRKVRNTIRNPAQELDHKLSNKSKLMLMVGHSCN